MVSGGLGWSEQLDFVAANICTERLSQKTRYRSDLTRINSPRANNNRKALLSDFLPERIEVCKKALCIFIAVSVLFFLWRGRGGASSARVTKSLSRKTGNTGEKKFVLFTFWCFAGLRTDRQVFASGHAVMAGDFQADTALFISAAS